MATKLVVLGIPWDVDTAGLRQCMSKFGELDDCIVMKERSTGRSRGFGYVTFASADDAKIFQHKPLYCCDHFAEVYRSRSLLYHFVRVHLKVSMSLGTELLK